MKAQLSSETRMSHGTAWAAVAGACGGVAVYIVAAKLAHPAAHFPAPLFPLLRAGVEEFSGITAAGLFLLGLVLGTFRPKSPIRMGFGTVALLPVAAFLEMAVDPTSHNLWLIEFLCYGVEALPAVIGALIGSRLRRLKQS